MKNNPNKPKISDGTVEAAVWFYLCIYFLKQEEFTNKKLLYCIILVVLLSSFELFYKIKCSAFVLALFIVLFKCVSLK